MIIMHAWIKSSGQIIVTYIDQQYQSIDQLKSPGSMRIKTVTQ